MSHSKTVKTVTKWEANDGKIFDSQDLANEYEAAISQTAKFALIESALEEYANKIYGEIKRSDKDIAKDNASILQLQQDNAKMESINRRLSTKKLSKGDQETVDENNFSIESNNELISELQKSILKHNDRKTRTVNGTYIPMLMAFSNYQPDAKPIFSNNYTAFYEFVISNTAKFIEWSTFASQTAGLNIDISKDHWWETSFDFKLGPK